MSDVTTKAPTGAPTTAADWYASTFDFVKLCREARERAAKPDGKLFATEMQRKANTHCLDTYITPGQLALLCRMARCEMPERRSAVSP